MSEFIGILQAEGRGGLVRPQGHKDMDDIHIAAADIKGAPYGMLVAVELISEADAGIVRGTIKEVLGDPGRPDVAMEGIMRQYGLSEEFPEAVLEEAKQLPAALSEEKIREELALGRRDLRELRTMTIDGKDARDLDDAVSIREEERGEVRLWVHIADVSYYVKEDSPLDIEAYKRGNSVYLADRVLPMLPPKLSNGICSLNPGQARLAMTCELLFNKEGRQIDGDIYESVICSDLRANYEDIKKSMDGNPPEDYAAYMTEIKAMETLARKLSEAAEFRGALDFEFPETKVEMAADGTVKAICPEPHSFANEIIEQFMIAANRFVAEVFTELSLPFLYRVHDWPDPEKLERFREALKRQGKTIKLSANPNPRELSAVLEDLHLMPGAAALQNLLLRSLAKAVYSSQPIGHYGLALDDYSHFTAPIRRYSDLFIHRVIRGYLRDQVKFRHWRRLAPEVAEQCSERERNAIDAERDSVDQKVVEYYAERIGEVYDAEVTGLIPAGIFVMLPSSAEGMIPFREMADYYVYDELSMTARGKDYGGVFTIGDRFPVRIARADVVRRQLDLVMVDEEAFVRKNKAFRKSRQGGRRSNAHHARKNKKPKRRRRRDKKTTKKRRGKRR